MSSHGDRMSEINFWAIPRPNTEEYFKTVAFLKENKAPGIDKVVKEIYQETSARVLIQGINGLGFPADKLLREFNGEYNGRVFRGSLHDMPASFNVVEAFNKFVPRGASFELRNEVDHFFSFDDFIDHVTSEENDSSETSLSDSTIEGQIYTYNTVGDVFNLDFSTVDGDTFSFSSVSLVRFGNEVSIILLAGKKCDLDHETDLIQKTEFDGKLFAHRSHLTTSDENARRAEPLFEGSDLWKTVVLVRFDVGTKTIDARYVLQDYGQYYSVISDDIESCFVDGKFIPEMEKVFKKNQSTIKNYDALFELAKICLHLPRYFEIREEDIVIERHPTDFLDFRKKLKNSKTIKLVSAKHCITHRQAFLLASATSNSSSTSEFYAPEYQIESSGFWKKLAPQAQGLDKNGQQIHGRTWVKQTLSWVEDTGSKAVKIEKKSGNLSSLPSSGVIYVMRSAAHEKDIFKIGLTRRTSSERANELTRKTGSPDHFLVAGEWPVSDCIRAEKLIHERLSSSRLNPKREFFRAPYSKIVTVICEVISIIEDENKERAS